jgi:ketosteroid isomerase-like protein
MSHYVRTAFVVMVIVFALAGCAAPINVPRERGSVMSTGENAQVILEIFSAIERRDPRRVLELCHPDVEFQWPPSLPYGGASPRGAWLETWAPLQPTEAERRMDPRVVAAGPEEVVVMWQQRGLSSTGHRFDGPVIGLYRVREGKLARAQMFYFDSAALANFLATTK